MDIEALAIQIADLAARIKRLEERYDNLVYKLEAIHRRSDEVQRRVDRQLDQFRAEQLDTAQIQELLIAIYDLGRRLPDLEQRMTTLEQQQAGDANVERTR